MKVLTNKTANETIAIVDEEVCMKDDEFIVSKANLRG